MQTVSIDLGFGYVKAISDSKRILFPSAVAPTDAQKLDGFKTVGHMIDLKKPGEIKKRNLAVGELAIKEGRAVQLSLDTQKFNKEISVVLALAAAGLVGAEGQINLALGLPIDIYRDKEYRDSVINTFNRVSSYVRIDGDPERYISFSNINCFPQGVGCIFSMESLPKDGLIGLADVGFYTTDLILFEVNQGKVTPLNSYIRSVNLGVSRALQLFIDSFAREVPGSSLTLVNAMEIWNRSKVTYRGKAVDIENMVREAKENVAHVITTAINEAWNEKMDFVEQVLLAGGGALELEDAFKNILPLTKIIEDPQYANAAGFYKMAEMIKEKSKTA